MSRFAITATSDDLTDEIRPADNVTALSGFLTQWIVALVVGFLAISTFEGALRFYAAQAGWPWIVYVKDVLLIGALFLGALNAGLTNLRNAPFLIVLAFLAAGTAVGVLILADIRQPLFAAKTWLPLLCGTVVGAAADVNSKFLRRACGVLWVAAVAGIGLTSVWTAPWVGHIYDVGGVALESSREWTIGETNRVPGFSRASFDAALQCLFFGTIVVTMTRRYAVALLVWVVTGAAIYLTLSRSALLALGVVVGLHALVISLKATQRLSKLAILVLATAVVSVPFVAGYYFKNKAGLADSSSVTSVSSFEERATKTWPEGLALPERDSSWVMGRGLGGIGVGQQFFEPDIFNPGDNFFVYLWGAFGVVGAVFVAFIPFQVWRAQIPFSAKRRAAIMIVGAFLAVGLTLNGIEAAIASLFLGMGLVWLTDQRLPE